MGISFVKKSRIQEKIALPPEQAVVCDLIGAEFSLSKELNMKFVEDPKAFADKKPVVAPGSTAREDAVKKWEKVPDQFKGVPGHLRIIAADLNDAGSHVWMDLNYNDVATKLGLGWMALYYLPWLEGNHVRTTLRPRKEKEGVDKLTVSNGYQDVNNPDIFFTAAVNGCMISVSGPVDEPTVYHSNANISVTTAIGSEEDERISHMAKELATFRDLKPKKTRSITETQKVRSVTADLYMPKERQDLLLNKPAIEQTDTRRTDKKLMGTIFGKRNDNKWTFYFERLVQYELSKFTTQLENDFSSGPPFKKIEVTDWRSQGSKYGLDGEVQEFWPNGVGRVLFG